MSKDFQNGFALGLASGGVVEVIDTTEIDNLEDLIDNSGVLEDTDGTVTEKVEELIKKAGELKMFFTAFAIGNSFDRNTLAFFNTAYQFKTIPKMDFSQKTTMVYSFANPNLEYIDYYLNSEKATNFSSCFYGTKNLKSIIGVDTTSATHVNEMFRGSGIETIREPFDFSNVTSSNNCFLLCNALKEIRFKEQSIKLSISFAPSYLLSAESIQSIIDGLATVETAQTLTLHSTITLTDEQKATINAKGWTLAQ